MEHNQKNTFLSNHGLCLSVYTVYTIFLILGRSFTAFRFRSLDDIAIATFAMDILIALPSKFTFCLYFCKAPWNNAATPWVPPHGRSQHGWDFLRFSGKDGCDWGSHIPGWAMPTTSRAITAYEYGKTQRGCSDAPQKHLQWKAGNKNTDVSESYLMWISLWDCVFWADTNKQHFRSIRLFGKIPWCPALPASHLGSQVVAKTAEDKS